MQKRLKVIWDNYRHGFLALLYMAAYLAWFFWLEGRVRVRYFHMHTPLDEMIPFCEFFAVPYMLWYLYVIVPVFLFVFKDKKAYYRTFAFLAGGMTVCMVIYTFLPTIQTLRPVFFERDNFFTGRVEFIYTADNAANVCPSIHVYNSIGVHIGVCKSAWLKEKKWIKYGSLALCILICASTVFIKQHSITDGLCAVALACIFYLVVYRPNLESSRGVEKKWELDAEEQEP